MDTSSVSASPIFFEMELLQVSSWTLTASVRDEVVVEDGPAMVRMPKSGYGCNGVGVLLRWLMI